MNVCGWIYCLLYGNEYEWDKGTFKVRKLLVFLKNGVENEKPIQILVNKNGA